MLQPRTLGVAALVGLLASTTMSAAASAGERAYFRGSTGGQYWSEPQVRLGVDVVWYPVPRPPVVWYPAYYASDRDYDPRYNPHYNQGHGRRHHKHHRHAHHAHDRDDCDD